MKILLTGASGQLGRALALPLGRMGDLAAPARAALDLADAKILKDALDAIQPALIVNAAAYTSVDQAEAELRQAYLVNAAAPEIMARWAAARGVPLVHFSTDYVYAGQGDTPHGEDEAPAPLSAYGASKLAGDEAIAQSGAPHLILRTSWLYGATGRNFLTTIVDAARTREELRVVDDQIGAPTPAALVAAIAMEILQAGELSELLAASGGIVHTAASGEASRHEFARAIIDGLRKRGCDLTARRVVPVPSAQMPTAARRPLNSRLSLARLAARFGIEPPDWRTVLRPVLDAVARAEKKRAP